MVKSVRPISIPVAKQRRPIGALLIAIPFAVSLISNSRTGLFLRPNVRLWSTLFVSVSVQALPFLVLGVVLSGAIDAFLPPGFLNRFVPSRTLFSVPAAGLAGMALPGCECGSVPIAGRLIANGMQPAAALTFLLAAPAINPVVLVSTAVAFPANRMVVVARFVASFLTAITVGWWWAQRQDSTVTARTDDQAASHDHDHGRSNEPILHQSHKPRNRHGNKHSHKSSPKSSPKSSLKQSQNHSHQMSVGDAKPIRNRLQRFVEAASRDLVHAGGYLVFGAGIAATIQLIIPRSSLNSIARNEIASILILAAMAVLMSICSEADAFVAAGLPQFSLTSRLVFMVVGPVLDLKLLSMQAGTFGKSFARVFAPVSLIIAVTSAVVVGKVLLG